MAPPYTRRPRYLLEDSWMRNPVTIMAMACLLGAPLVSGCYKSSESGTLDAQHLIITRGDFAPQITSKEYLDQDMHVRISFRIDRAGTAVDISTEKGSGNRGLDVAAIMSVERTRFDPVAASESKSYFLDFGLNDRYLSKPY